MLRIQSLEAGYGALRVLKGISLHVDPREIVSLIGPNGAGKTTLMRSVSGILRPGGGRILFNGRDLCGLAAERIVELGCALVPEGRQVFGTLSVRDNLILGAYRHLRRRLEVHERLEKIYALFPILQQRSRQYAGSLSGGEQQMLALGRALMSAPSFLMLDEPSMGIAPKVVAHIFQTLRSLRAQGMTILLVEQNARASLDLADRGYVLETGRIVLEGSARELLDNRDLQRSYLGKEYRRIDEPRGQP